VVLAGSGMAVNGLRRLMFRKGDDIDSIRCQIGHVEAPHRICSIRAAAGSVVCATAPASTKAA
jgi:hypothetical protein